MIRESKKTILAVLMAATIWVAGQGSQAAAIFNSLASVDMDLVAIFEITSDFQGISLTDVPIDLIVTANASLDETSGGTKNGSANTIGSDAAFASTVGIVNPLTHNHTIKLESNTQGSTFQPPDSTATATAQGNGTVTMQNNSAGSTYILAFNVERIFNIGATESQPDNDSASAQYHMSLAQQSLGTLFDVSGTVFSDGDTSDFGSRSRIVAVTLAPGAGDVLTLQARSFGQASSLIPEPTSAAVLGLAGLAMLSRRRRGAA